METTSPDSISQDKQAVDASVDLATLAQESKEILGAMLPLLSFEAKLTSSVENQSVRIRVECENAARLIGRKGATVNEIQFLLNRILQRRHKMVPRIFLDVDGPKEAQAIANQTVNEKIVEQAQALAERVRRWGEPLELGPIHAVDRKAIQEVFAKDRELEVIAMDPNLDPTKPQRVQIRVKQKS